VLIEHETLWADLALCTYPDPKQAASYDTRKRAYDVLKQLETLSLAEESGATQMNVISSMGELRRRVRAAFDRTLQERVPSGAVAEVGRWHDFSAAVALIARASEPELREFAAAAKEMGFAKPNRDDAIKAAGKLQRWAKALKQ
jgi:hypothetical protein